MTRNILSLLLVASSFLTFAQIDLGIKRGPCFQKSLDRLGQRYVDWECEQNGAIVDCNEALESDPGSNLVLSRNSGSPFTGDCESCYMNGLRKHMIHFSNGRVDGIDSTYYQSGCPQVVRNHILGVESGTWTFYNDTSGLVAWEINYNNGEKHGRSIFFKQKKVGMTSVKFEYNGAEETLEYPSYENDTLRIEHYSNGLLEGVKKTYWPDSKLQLEAEYSKGLLHGKFISYDMEGNVMEELSYKEGQKHGECKYYYNDGSLLKTETWRDGIKDGEFKTFYIQGHIQELETYRRGQKHGNFMERFPDNKIKREAVYRRDVLVEEHVYDKYGNEIRTVGDKVLPKKEDDEIPTSKPKKEKKEKKNKKNSK